MCWCANFVACYVKYFLGVHLKPKSNLNLNCHRNGIPKYGLRPASKLLLSAMSNNLLTGNKRHHNQNVPTMLMLQCIPGRVIYQLYSMTLIDRCKLNRHIVTRPRVWSLLMTHIKFSACGWLWWANPHNGMGTNMVAWARITIVIPQQPMESLVWTLL